MSGRLAIDFGTSNTVVAVFDEAAGEGRTVSLPGIGRSLSGDDDVARVPSLIHYAADHRRWIGEQVAARHLRHNPRTFWWMKRYVSARSPRRRRLDGRDVGEVDAARDFLADVLVRAIDVAGGADQEVAFTVPVESFEHYEHWLAGVAAQVGITRYRLLDEPSAAVLGYGTRVRSGEAVLIVDFGGGTLDVSVVVLEEAAEALAGRRCRVLGKAGADLGGADLDQWLYAEVLRREGLDPAAPSHAEFGRSLLAACEAVKERLSLAESAELRVADPDTGRVVETVVTRPEFEALLDRHDMLAQLDRTLRRALREARDRGYDDDDIRSVLLIGGGSRIPAVQATLRRIFGRDRVRGDRPVDAVARGAAAFVAGVDLYDHIQHDYALRFRDPATGQYAYRVLVPRGTPYPTEGPVARQVVKGALDGQSQLGLAIFELGANERSPGPELVFDPTGAVSLVAPPASAEASRSRFWMNESTPTFLVASPPARRGEACFEVAFSIDAHKRLLVTARDLRSGCVMLADRPVVKLV